MGVTRPAYIRRSSSGDLRIGYLTTGYPPISYTLTGVMTITTGTGDELIFTSGLTPSLQLDYASNVTTLSGGAVTGDDLKLKCNTTDTRSFINLYGNAGALVDLTTGSSFEVADAGVAIANIAVGGGSAGGVLKLKETTTPTPTTDYGAIYTKADNHLYFQDGAGAEHDLGGA